MRLPEKRIIEIKELIKKEKTVSVERISQLFNISALTVRRDLARLDSEGFLNKVHGGAVFKEFLEPEPIFSDRVKLFTEEKDRIAREAAKRINDNDAIILESGSTCLRVVRYLSDKKNLQVSTAGIPIADELCRLMSFKKDVEVSVSGGIVRPGSGVYVGPHAVNYFRSINVDKLFLSAVGISPEKGVTTATQYDSELIKAMVESAIKTILICDSSKFGVDSYINVITLDKVDEIITDKNIDKTILGKIKSIGVKITCV
jgi:DeoR/GlpR family transcriptional regulator of sugar metabolism